MVQHAKLLDETLDTPDCTWKACLHDVNDHGVAFITDVLGAITHQNVLMMRDQNTVPVFYSWLTTDEFESIRENEHNFVPALKAWLELLDWADEEWFDNARTESLHDDGGMFLFNAHASGVIFEVLATWGALSFETPGDFDEYVRRVYDEDAFSKFDIQWEVG
eukprot:CAMPEP_0198520314 /NCGR_PEP_ID=MMETSP1462-20131121/20253_1 /TAXON_ID=1333877 /ORGANISM="Brandtodinium nutriculum, Strain RCC3387" /LENGTH=162 /DNA_ID=CAMNT_0044249939 /DNA_START=18 /DNA_END=507 /DNA_ORIENTATION=-